MYIYIGISSYLIAASNENSRSIIPIPNRQVTVIKDEYARRVAV